MKKILLAVLVFVMTGAGQSLAQGQKYSIGRMSYQSNEDVEVAKERVKAELDKDKTLTSFQRAIAKKMAGSIVKKAFKTAAENQYVYGFNNGEFTNYCYWDIDANRSVVLCPQMGRITINDWTNRKSIVAFPMLKMALVMDLTQAQIDAAAKAGNDAKSIWSVKPLYEFQEVTEINGFPACTNVAYIPVPEGQEAAGQTAVVNGVTVELFPMPGHLLMKNDKEFYYGAYVDGETNSPTAYFSQELLETGDCSINEANFVLPEGYKVFKDFKSFNKVLLKEVKNNTYVLPDPGKIPEVVWQ